MSPPLLSAHGLCKSYTRQALIRRHPPCPVLHDIDLGVAEGESLAILGRSGSGKSTLIRQLLGIERPTAGVVRFEGRDLRSLDGAGWRAFRRAAQMVFQDSHGAVNPRFSVGRIIAEPLCHLTDLPPQARAARVGELLEAVGLVAQDADKWPTEMSGGQLQRVCIARALATNPRLLVLDEAVSNLDILLQVQILALLRDLRERLGMAVVFITHDLRLVRLLSERVVVLEAGRIVESCAVSRRLTLTSPEGAALQSAVLPPTPARALLSA